MPPPECRTSVIFREDRFATITTDGVSEGGLYPDTDLYPDSDLYPMCEYPPTGRTCVVEFEDRVVDVICQPQCL